MSVNAIRGLVLAANVLLIGLIGWLCYSTFVVVDKEKYFVEPPALRKFQVPEVAVDESQQKKELYRAIARILDRPPPPPPPPPPSAGPAAAPTADPRQIQIIAMNVPIDGRGIGSALISAPQANPKEPKFIQVGMDLGALQELKAYDGVRLKAVTEKEVIFLDKQGNEVKVPGPRPEGGK